MKTIGLLGGMSWESTAHYYAEINQLIKAQLGGLHSAKIAMISVDFAEIEALQRNHEWQKAGDILAQAAQQLAAAGADCLVICTNTMHKVADQIIGAIDIPLLHIVDATGAEIKTAGYQKVALLGTAFTMSEGFYRDRLSQAFEVEVLVPNTQDQSTIHHIIYQELCLGQINETSRSQYLNIIDRLVEQGAQAIILGCTEIGLLVQQSHTRIPLLDTTQLHAAEAVRWALHSVADSQG